jgi:hypothetical protein
MAAGKTALDAVAGAYTNRAMIVLTDGLENTQPWISQVTGLPGHTFAIGFGQAAAISTAALNRITQNNGGYLVVTGPITQEEGFALTEYFLKIQAGVTNSSAVLDPRGELIIGVTHRIPFRLSRADQGVDVVLLSPAPYVVDFRLEAPDGTIIDPSLAAGEPAIEHVLTPRVAYYRASLPMLTAGPEGSHQGVWHVLLGLGEQAKHADRETLASIGKQTLPYSLLVHAYSDLSFRPSMRQASLEPGATVQLAVALDQYGVPLDSPATIWADITRPDGSTTTMSLTRTSAGRWSASFTADDIGIYSAMLQARGVTMDGDKFERQQRLTAVTFLGADQPSQQEGADSFCRLVDCLREGEAGRRVEVARWWQLWRRWRLRTAGINLGEIPDCLAERCDQERQAGLGGEQPYRPGAKVPALPATMADLTRSVTGIGDATAVPSRFAEAALLVPPTPAPAAPPMEAGGRRRAWSNPFPQPGVPPLERTP